MNLMMITIIESTTTGRPFAANQPANTDEHETIRYKKNMIYQSLPTKKTIKEQSTAVFKPSFLNIFEFPQGGKLCWLWDVWVKTRDPGTTRLLLLCGSSMPVWFGYQISSYPRYST